MIIEESKYRLLNKDKESEESVSISLIRGLHLFLHQIRFYHINQNIP